MKRSIYAIMALSVMTWLLPAEGRQGMLCAQSVSVNVSRGDAPQAVKAVIGQQTAAFLTAINESTLDDGKKMKDRMKALLAEKNAQSKALTNAVMDLWDQSPMYCITSEVEAEVTPYAPTGGYEMRGITVNVMEASPETAFCPLALTYDSEGNLCEVNVALESRLVSRAVVQGRSDTERANRQLIVNFVESLLTGYSGKDGSLLKQVYSDDPLLLTPTGLKKKSDSRMVNAMLNGLGSERSKRASQERRDYLQQVQRMLSRAPWFRIEVDDIQIMQHPMRANFYGVSLHQRECPTLGTDSGWLLMVFNLEDPANPCLELRIWQTEGERLQITDLNIR